MRFLDRASVIGFLMGAAPLLIGLIALPFGTTSDVPPAVYFALPITVASPVVGGLLVRKLSVSAVFKVGAFIWLGLLTWMWVTVVYPSICSCSGLQAIGAIISTAISPLAIAAIAIVVGLVAYGKDRLKKRQRTSFGR